jgi:hypothetical protein
MIDPARRRHPMTLGERCDEIVRLIDETLGDLDASSKGKQPAPARIDPHRTGTDQPALAPVLSLVASRES